ncbi:hypothetical protein E8D34_09370 [Nocardioides sp. GY 10113]|uniref:hypothetical protein n=1 Tax=Nocardioides sp. GY 10113 TaxID=2569761 RepID=UPI0010A85479|nr:hypothetical protein [Nocardioides sp. GY 10113]TIC87340.1 hypothetical protein E8D34_09370 [Nocardioides sp. GY 10113]
MIEAHGIGGQADLPIPLSYAVAGAVAALVVSFVVLIVAWRTPRYATPGGRPAWRWLDAAAGSPVTAVALRVVGMVLLLFTAATAVAGQNALTNPFFGIVYVWWWVGLVAASLLLGPVWRAISPVRTINALLAKVSGGDPEQGILAYPERLGHWPAALGLYAFVWLELVYRYPADLGAVRLWCAIYLAAMLVGGALFGNRFYERADPFEVYSTLIAHLSPWARHEGRLVVRSPLANLATVTPRPGLVAVVGVLFGSTAFDSFRESSFWISTTYDASWSKFTLDNLGLLVFCGVAVGALSLACSLVGIDVAASGRRRLELADLPVPHRQLPAMFAHSMVPIIAGYIVAHYLTLLIDVGTQTLARASDPFGRGWDMLGTAGLEPSYWFSYHPTVLATTKVLAVVAGHIAAAVAAHDRAVEILPRRHQVIGQLPLLVVMVAFTAGGLYLLFNA